MRAGHHEIEGEAAYHARLAKEFGHLFRIVRDGAGIGGVSRKNAAEITLSARAAKHLIVGGKQLDFAERCDAHLHARAAHFAGTNTDPFLDDAGVEIYGVEAAGHGLSSGQHAASLTGGRPGVLHGNRTYLLMDDDGQIKDAHSISAGLDYPGIGPEHSWLHDRGRVTYLSATDNEALAAFQLLSRLEGIIPALEPAHALAQVAKLAPQKPREHLMIVNLCGRGDKDIFAVAEHLGHSL